MESVTPAQLFEMLGRLYAAREIVVAERDQARASAQQLARMLEKRGEPVSPNGEPVEVPPSPTT